jgi:hypothetical protein
VFGERMGELGAVDGTQAAHHVIALLASQPGIVNRCSPSCRAA